MPADGAADAAQFPSLNQMLAKISEGIPVDGMESLSPRVDRLRAARVLPPTDYRDRDHSRRNGVARGNRAVSLVGTSRSF
jgi:transcription-repair coupling factor (superfamily II helicase)